MEKVIIERLPITLAQFLKWANVAINGGEAKGLIRDGLVSLNGTICLVAGQKLEIGDLVAIAELKFIVANE